MLHCLVLAGAYLRGLDGVVDQRVAVDAAEAGQGVVGVVAHGAQLPVVVGIVIIVRPQPSITASAAASHPHNPSQQQNLI